MKKSSLTLLVAGALAMAGAVQAQTWDVPQQAGEISTMTQGQPNMVTSNAALQQQPSLVIVDTRVLGAGPVLLDGVSPPNPYVPYQHGQATAISNLPDRAGEFSTMTGGMPNMITDHNSVPQAISY